MSTIKQTLKTLFILGSLTFFMGLMYSCAPKNLAISKIEGKQISIDTSITADANIDAYVSPYRLQLESEMNTILAYAPFNLYSNRKDQETLLGNFLSDLCYHRANPVFNQRTNKNIDFVLLNVGGLRAPITMGDVTVKNAYEVMPFENALVVAELSYDKLKELIQYLADSGNPHPISGQLHVVFNGNTVESALLNSKEFDPNLSYFVLTSDYLLNGGDNMTFFLNPVSNYDLDYKVRNALLDELKAIDTITTKLDGRMIRK